MNPNKIVVLTGAALSAESGIHECPSTDDSWKCDYESVLNDYNALRHVVASAKPNSAHIAINRLSHKYDLTVITQSIADLHEKCGGSHPVIHLNGEITKARSSINPGWVYEIGYDNILPGDLCPDGYQIRPHVVFEGEDVFNFEDAAEKIKEAGRVLVAGISFNDLTEQLLKKARGHALKVIVQNELKKKPFNYQWLKGNATQWVPSVVNEWVNNPGNW